MKKRLFIVTILVVAALSLSACGYTIVPTSSLQTAPPATAAPQFVPDPTPVPTVAPTIAPTPVPTPPPTVAPTVAPTPVPTPAPTPIPVPTAAPTPVPATSSLPRVTKHPAGEKVAVNGKCQFVTRYENAIYAEWHFVSPDGYRDLDYVQAQKEFPSMRIINGYAKDMTLENIPASLNGWKVYCRFMNNSGATNTNTALITVTGQAAPVVQSASFDGRWAEATSGRCQITFTLRAAGSYNVDISWSSSAWERSRWKMTGNASSTNMLVYYDGHSWTESYVSDSNYSISNEAFGGSGSFSIQGNNLYWVNNQTGQTTAFVRA